MNLKSKITSLYVTVKSLLVKAVPAVIITALTIVFIAVILASLTVATVLDMLFSVYKRVRSAV